jgi:signal transduction histidine kinase
MSSDLAGSAQGAPTRRGLGLGLSNGHVGSGPGPREPAPAGNGSTGPPGAAVDPAPDPAAVLTLWERERLLEERERIADDLHDHVIARLFAAALNLERVMGTLGPGPLAAQLEVTVDGLDETIFQLRRMIGRLKQQTASVGDGGGAALAGRLLNVMAESSPALGFDPVVRLTGLDVPLPEDIDEDLLAVLREALTNVARHAEADSVEVEVAATADRLTVKVTDDGTGIAAAPARRSGLTNMHRRAHDHRGAFSAEALHRSGSRVTWTVPLH